MEAKGNSSPNNNTRFGLVFLFVIAFIAGVTLRVHSILRESAIGDELFTQRVTMAPLDESLQIIMKINIVTPPVHYMVSKAWGFMFGHGLVELRFLSLFFGLALIIMTVLSGIFIFRDKKIALFAGILVAGSDLQILFSHFARNYTMYSFLVLVLISVYWYGLHNPDKWHAWIAFVCVGTALVYTHYIGWLYLMSTMLVAFTKDFRSRLKPVLISNLSVVLLFIPWVLAEIPLIRARGGFEQNIGWIKTPDLLDFPYVFARYNGLPGIKYGMLLSLIIGSFFVVMSWKSIHDQQALATQDLRRKGIILLSFIAIMPPCLLFILARPPFELSIWGVRHLMPSQALWVLLVAVGMMSFLKSKRFISLFVILAVASLQWLPSIYNTSHFRFPPSAKIAAYLEEEKGENERVFQLIHLGLNVINYHLGPSVEVKVLPENPARIPDSFWLLYNPKSKLERDKVTWLRHNGFSIRQSNSFKNPNYFRKSPDDMWVLRVILLSRIKIPHKIKSRK